MPAIFQPQIAKKNQLGALSQGNSNLYWPYRLLWWDSYKGVECALTFDKSILHKIIIISSVVLDPQKGKTEPMDEICQLQASY